MKKIVLSAAIAAIAMSATAQETASGTLNARALLEEVIVLSPSSQTSNPGSFFGITWNTFDDISDYNNGLDLVESPEVSPGSFLTPFSFEFSVASSLGYDVTATTTSDNFLWSATNGSFAADVQTYPIPASALTMTVNPPSGVGPIESPAGTFAFGAAGTYPMYGHAMGHTFANWSVNLNMDPGYGHQGGYYNLPITITATTR